MAAWLAELAADSDRWPLALGLYSLLVGLVGVAVGFAASFLAQEGAARRRHQERIAFELWQRKLDVLSEALSRLKQWNYYSLYRVSVDQENAKRVQDKLFGIYDRLLEIEPLLTPHTAIAEKYKEVMGLCLDAGLRAHEYSAEERQEITASVDVLIFELAALVRKEQRQRQPPGGSRLFFLFAGLIIAFLLWAAYRLLVG
jgi:hypothetical protein